MTRRALALILSLSASAASEASAVPGPDSVAVVANANVPGSVALAERYRAARAIPRGQVCALDLPEVETLPLTDFVARFMGPLMSCLEAAGAQARIEAVVLVRGVPLRVELPGAGRASLAAALGTWRSVETATGLPLLGKPPGREQSCGGTPCSAAAWENPFRRGAFRAGWSATRQGIEHRPVLVTMLHGRSFEDAAKLVASATTAEASGGASGTFVFMNGADPARGALDLGYPAVIAELQRRGFTDVERVPFQSDLTGLRLASFFVGTAALGRTIEGNEFLPGAITDNLTSFGALPENFRESGEELQVSVARFVARGVAGTHGATDEPLNNSFPSRLLLIDYVEGGTLGEAYLRHMPFVYWHNLVLGDVMAAPYARRPRVNIRGVAAGQVVCAPVALEVEAEDPLGRPLQSLALYVDGRQVEAVEGDLLAATLELPVAAEVQLLAVAQVADNGSPGGAHQPKGWTELLVVGAEGTGACVAGPDAGGLDAGAVDAAHAPDGGAVGIDAGPPLEEAEGCGCRGAPRPGPQAVLLLVLLLLGVRLRQR